MRLNELVNLAFDMATEKGFHDAEINIPEKLMLIVSELSEACEHYRSGNNNTALHRIWRNDGVKPDGFAVELADAVIRIADLCGRLGVDLEYIVREKMSYNRTRPKMHGKNC